MPYGLYISAEGAHAQAKRLEVITNNLANVDTVGFKRELAAMQARYAEQTQRGLDQPGSGSINDLGGGVLVRQTKTDFSSGPIKQTGIPTDMAIRGEGFFVIRREGETYLTRAGNFRLTSRGELVTQFGNEQYAVLSDAGTPIRIDEQANGPWEVSPTGAIRQRGQVQNLALVRPTSLGDLMRVGENLFKPLADPQPVPPSQRSVVSGHLEMSGVNPMSEMVDLIEASRVLEANLNLMQAQDQMLGGLIARVMRSV